MLKKVHAMLKKSPRNVKKKVHVMLKKSPRNVKKKSTQC